MDRNEVAVVFAVAFGDGFASGGEGGGVVEAGDELELGYELRTDENHYGYKNKKI